MRENGKKLNETSSAEASIWKQEDMAFAAAELSREFPTRPLPRVLETVSFAIRNLPPHSGRVKLMQEARKIISII